MFANGAPVSCDYLTYSVIKDFTPVETVTVSGVDGGFSLSVECDGLGEIAFHVTVCDADGNPIEGIAKYDERNLVLSAAISKDGTPISGAIRSLGKYEQTYGYYECRAKLQQASGFWGAFRLLNREMSLNTEGNNSAKDGVEIDIFESNSVSEGAINHALHWDGCGANHKSNATSIKNVGYYDGEYHVFGMLRNEQGYTFFIDGKQTCTLTGVTPGSCELPCNMKLSVEFGSWVELFSRSSCPTRFWSTT